MDSTLTTALHEIENVAIVVAIWNSKILARSPSEPSHPRHINHQALTEIVEIVDPILQNHKRQFQYPPMRKG